MKNTETFCKESAEAASGRFDRNQTVHVIMPPVSDRERQLPLNRRETILVTKAYYDVMIDICIGNFMRILGDRYRMLFVPTDQLTEEILDYVDIIIFVRTFDAMSSRFMEKVTDQPVIYLLDDDLLNVHRMGEGYRHLAPGKPAYQELVYQLTNADLVISYSPQITVSVSRYANKVVEMKTNILGQYIRRDSQKTQNPFRIAFVSGYVRREELAFIWKDLLAVAETYRDKVEFYFWGQIPSNLNELRGSKVYIQPYIKDYYTYLTYLHRQSFDLILAPLFERDGKIGKSPVKYLEAAVCGAIGLYSPAQVYNIIHDNVNGFKAKNKSGEWAKKIMQIIQMNPAHRQAIYENAKKDLLEYFTTESQVDLFQNTMEMGKLQQHLGGEGTICYVFWLDGEEERAGRLFQAALLTHSYPFRVLICMISVNGKRNHHLESLCSANHLDCVLVNYDSTLPAKLSGIARERNIQLFHAALPFSHITDLAAMGDAFHCFCAGGEEDDFVACSRERAGYQLFHSYNAMMDAQIVSPGNANPDVLYQCHIQAIGWQNGKSGGEVAGTEKRSLRLEALQIRLVNPLAGMRIRYQVHVQNTGWQNWVSDGEMAGTVGRSLRIEAVRIRLEPAQEDYSVYYQVHVQDWGWSRWKRDGAVAGTVGQSRRMEAVRIRIVRNSGVRRE